MEGSAEEVIDSRLNEEVYDESKVPEWVSEICEGCIAELAEKGKPFKYMVSCVIFQDTGAGLHSAHSSFCDGVNDGVVTVKWPTDKNKDQNTICCVATVFGSAIFSR